MNIERSHLRRVADDERGAVLVITVLVMLVLLVASAYAIDTAIWFVHGRHLQSQADAAALAAAQDYQFCSSGSSIDTAVIARVHQYDGTAITAAPASYSGPTPLNGQVPVIPAPATTYSSNAHNLISRVNQADFINQTGNPGDTGMTGSPCADGNIDVKLSETNLPSFFPFGNPGYITRQARVGFQTAATAAGEPFIEPIPTPSSVAVEFVNEANGTVLSTPGVVTLTPSSGGTTWTALSVPINVADPTSGSTTNQFPIGMRVAVNPTGSTATFPCTGSETCYDASSTANLGIRYIRAWSNSGTPGTPTANPVAPQAGDVWLQPCTASGSSCTSCPTTKSASNSNFFTSSTSTSEQLCANMTFTSTGGPLSCSTASLTMKAGGTAVTMNCPTGGPNGTWSSGPVTVPVNAGEMGLTMSWGVTAGCLPVGASGGTVDASNTCTQGATHKKCTAGSGCTGNFDGNTSAETVQQAYSGADNLVSGATSNSGTISSAAVTDSSGNEIQSIHNGTNTTGNTITLGFYGFQSSSSVSSAPVELALGGNQGNGNLGCNGNGAPQFQAAVANGCPTPPVYGATSAPGTSACPGTNPVVCVNTNPGNGKSKRITQGLDDRINGGSSSSCGLANNSGHNYWTSPNSVGQILAQSFGGQPDPRLVTLFYTDPGPLPGGSSPVPIRGFAEFYITGWGGGDPCLSTANGGSGTAGTNSNTGLSYIPDDQPPNNADGVVMGHFVTYVNGPGTGTGNACVQGSLNVCVAVLTK